MSESEDGASAASSDEEVPARWLSDVGETICAFRELVRAQWQLLGAELRLARSAALTLLVTALLITVLAVGLGLTLLTLLGLGLAHWFGSWVWALVAVSVLLILGLVAAIVLGWRCLHWLSLPETRAQWHAIARRAVAASPRKRPSAGEASADENSSQTG